MTNGIEQAIAEFDLIAQQCRANDSKVGYFAALYRGVTVSMIGPVMMPKTPAEPGGGLGELGGFFDDFDRADAFVDTFAGRYFEAFHHRDELDPGHPWAIHFEYCSDPKATILQILTSGANAHMNLDLTMAAIATADGDLDALKHDFNLINEVLMVQIAACQQQVLDVSPLMKFVNVAPRLSAKMVGFVIQRARSLAWEHALNITRGQNAAHSEAELAEMAAGLGRRIVRPPLPLRLVLGVAARFEPDSAQDVIDKLLDAEPDVEVLTAALHRIQ